MTLEEVMVSLQKANLSFQAMIAVRNRLVEAYKEVTNLQV
jgi:flagellar hook-basal body complex protein FliE